MKQAAGRASLWKRVCGAARLVLLATPIVVLTACKLSGPPPAEYVLGVTPPATATTIPQTGLPVVEVKRVQVPEYLDTTDLLERRGNELVPSPTGRWGERLSVGMTRALTASLATRLPRLVVTSTPVVRAERQILVDVAAFEARADHHAVLVARWTILDGASRQILTVRQNTLVEAVRGTGDGAVTTAMSHALEDLADQLAAGIEHDLVRSGSALKARDGPDL